MKTFCRATSCMDSQPAPAVVHAPRAPRTATATQGISSQGVL